jgi:hypothetical protein
MDLPLAVFSLSKFSVHVGNYFDNFATSVYKVLFFTQVMWQLFCYWSVEKQSNILNILEFVIT